MRRRSRQILLVVAALAFLCSARGSAQPEWRWSQTSKIVVVPDIHGAYAELVTLLQATHILDADLEWAAGDATLVSLGDLLDRGAESRKVLELLMRLQHSAAARGGAVRVLLGNHELMNLTGDLRYVAAADYAAFAGEEPQLRDSAYERFLAERPASEAEGDAKAAFERLYPPGFFARERAFRADGRYGAWLLTLPALIVINDTAFVHGGLPEIVAKSGAAALDEKIAGDMRRYLALRSRLEEAGILPAGDPRRDAELARAARDSGALTRASEQAKDVDEFLTLGEAPELGVEGPLWYRGSVYCNPFLEEPVLDAALARLDAARVVVGHTPTEDRRPRALYDGRLIMLDTGMLTSYYAGRPAALVIDGARAFVQELAPEQEAPLEQGRLEAYGLTEPQVVDALSKGTVLALGDGSNVREPVRVKVRYAGKTIEAVFYPQGRTRAAAHELAAHGLDRLLGLNLVPPTVEREVEGQGGALQLVYPDAITESQRIEQRIPLGGWCPLEPQAQLMRVFDVLTYNTGRTGDDIIYRREYSVLKLIGHGRAFGTERRLSLRPGAIALTPALDSALASLDEGRLEAAIGKWVDAKQIKALLGRRDALLEQASPPR